MLHVDAPVSTAKKAVFVPLADIGKAVPFQGESLNVYAFPRYQLVDSGGVHYIALPWTWETLRKLAVHDIFVPGPIRWNYHWPSKYPCPMPHQVVTADFFTQNPRAFCYNEIGCVSGDTEYLTPSGWRRIDQYDGGLVAQYWPETGKADFVKPLEYVDMPCDEMYRFDARGADQLLSKEHRVLYKTARGQLKTELAEKVAHDHWNSKWWHYGKLITDFTLETEGVDLTDDELRLWVAVVADGHIWECKTKCDRVAISVVKPRKKARLEALLSRIGIEWKATQGGQPSETRYAFDWNHSCKDFDALWGASVAQRQVVIDECVYWDGSVRKDRGNKFSTARVDHADFIQWCAVSTGKQATRLEWQRDGTTYYDVYFKMRKSYPAICGYRKEQVTKVPAPGGRKYCFMTPSKYLVLRRKGKVFMSGNTSKTLSALWAADYLMTLGHIGRVLIVSTVSTLHRTWSNEIFSNIFGRTHTVIDGSAARRKKRLKEGTDFHIINHDGVKGLEDELIKADYDLIIVDEGAVYRNQKTGLWRSIYNVAGIHTNRWLWWMTGGPMPKAPTDVWAQAKVVRPDTVPRYFKQFRNMTMVEVGNFKWVPIKGYEEIVFNTLRPVIRYTRDVCKLPPDHSQDIKVDMSPGQKKAYELMEKDTAMQIEQELVTAANEGVVRMKLLQIAAGAIYTNEGRAVSLDPEPKFLELDNLLDESGRKLIVYAPFKYCLPMIAQRYEEKGYKVATISGDTPPTKRNQIFQDFQDGDLELLIAHPKCMAHGLTLTRSNIIAWWAPVDDYEIYDQSCGRIKRPGQDKEQYIIHLTSSAVETEIYRRLKTKERMQGLVMDLYKKS